MNFKFYTALLFAKLSYLLLKVLHRPATSFAGYIALKICPDFMRYTKNYIKKGYINITGTNGKTTTSGLIGYILSSNGKRTIHNLKGANMLTGIVNTFALGIYPLKTYDYSVIETDEAFLTKVYDFAKGDFLTVTNLFCDQLDRYGEVNFTQKIIDEAISKNPDLTVILNADDPNTAHLGQNNKRIFYGFEDIRYFTKYSVKNEDTDKRFVCQCQNSLKYTKHFYAQQGHFYCETCGYNRPTPDYNAIGKIYDNKFELEITHRDKTDKFEVNLVGVYNAYNALAAIVTAFENGLDTTQIQTALNSYKASFGRSEARIIDGHKAIVQLIKNPAGANEVLKTVDLSSNIIIAINNTVSDGRDTSWFWDTNFERLKDAEKPITVSGICAYDLALRLKYAGVPEKNIIIEEDIKKAIKFTTGRIDKDETLTILPSYTVLLKISKY